MWQQQSSGVSRGLSGNWRRVGQTRVAVGAMQTRLSSLRGLGSGSRGLSGEVDTGAELEWRAEINGSWSTGIRVWEINGILVVGRSAGGGDGSCGWDSRGSFIY